MRVVGRIRFAIWLIELFPVPNRFFAVGEDGELKIRGLECASTTHAGPYTFNHLTAQFCAHPRSKTIALGSNGTGRQIACIGAENQHDSKSSHSVGKASAATVNRRVASSNLARYPIQNFSRSQGTRFFRRCINAESPVMVHHSAQFHL